MPSVTLPVRIDRSAYQLGQGGARTPIAYTVTNTGAAPIFLAHCGQRAIRWRLERRDGAAWQLLGTGYCPLILVPPVEVAPGVSVTDTALVGPGPGLAPDELRGELRLIVAAYATVRGATTIGDTAALLPIERRASPPFLMR